MTMLRKAMKSQCSKFSTKNVQFSRREKNEKALNYANVIRKVIAYLQLYPMDIYVHELFCHQFQPLCWLRQLRTERGFEVASRLLPLLHLQGAPENRRF